MFLLGLSLINFAAWTLMILVSIGKPSGSWEILVYIVTQTLGALGSL